MKKAHLKFRGRHMLESPLKRRGATTILEGATHIVVERLHLEDHTLKGGRLTNCRGALFWWRAFLCKVKAIFGGVQPYVEEGPRFYLKDRSKGGSLVKDLDLRVRNAQDMDQAPSH